MKNVIAKLEAALGPNFALDCAIAEAHLPSEWFGSKVESWFGRGTGVYGCNTADGKRHLECQRAPNYTASMDAAITLLPDGLYWMAGYGKTREDEPLGGVAIFLPGNEDDPVAKAEAPTVPLAMCLAALRARADQQTGDQKP